MTDTVEPINNKHLRNMEKWALAELIRPTLNRVVVPANGVIAMIARIRAQDAEIKQLMEACHFAHSEGFEWPSDPIPPRLAALSPPQEGE